VTIEKVLVNHLAEFIAVDFSQRNNEKKQTALAKMPRAELG